MTPTKLPAQIWNHDGRQHRVCLFVEGDKVVGMTPVESKEVPHSRNSPVIAARPGDERKYLGDHIANGLGKLGAKPCSGCNKRKKWFNDQHKKVAKLFG